MAQLAEKDNNLQKWREERDQLVAALEIQLKALASSNLQKDNEIEQLQKKITSEASKIVSKTLFFYAFLKIENRKISELFDELLKAKNVSFGRPGKNQSLKNYLDFFHEFRVFRIYYDWFRDNNVFQIEL